MAVAEQEFEAWDDEDIETRDYVRHIAEAAGEVVCSLMDYLQINSLNNRSRVAESLTSLGDRVLIFMKETE